MLNHFLCRPFLASAALTILSSASRTAEFPVTDSKWLIVPPYASCYCSHLSNLIIWRSTMQLMQPHLFIFFHTQILTVNSSLPVRWRASSGISSLRFRRKCLTLGYQGSCSSSAWRVMRPGTDKGAELILSSTPPRHPIHRGHGGQASQDPP